MTLKEIYQFFQTQPPFYLNQELSACYVLSVLLQGDSYGTELVERVEREYPPYRLSDTVLYKALKFLEQEAVIAGYWKKTEGRGRPRRMYYICPDMQEKAVSLARLWQEYSSNTDAKKIATVPANG
ncbi:PadR family transcriptional regulator [Kovacikia minuta CCNUW1]|uniref:PadR family transcriptional regulator n=1 Tax=Kovacikia minuta TaxID=2931930 RepID=UPI001CCBBDBD|nr:PadR family transcriptional regulator [Kovacikia minuta]UBF26343.1 PadR family transcriptional regulator [Kovacikia minuta CCNUW1]